MLRLLHIKLHRLPRPERWRTSRGCDLGASREWRYLGPNLGTHGTLTRTASESAWAVPVRARRNSRYRRCTLFRLKCTEYVVWTPGLHTTSARSVAGVKIDLGL